MIANDLTTRDGVSAALMQAWDRIAVLEATLRGLSGDLYVWRNDVECGLSPYLDNIVRAEECIRTALKAAP